MATIWHDGELGRVVRLRVPDRGLPGLDGLPRLVSDRFHGWRGRSGRRYVASVHRVDPDSPDFGLPDHDAFVLIAVAHDGRGPRVLSVASVERARDRAAAGAAGLAAGACEWHVHLLAEDRRARLAVVADIDVDGARHAVRAMSA